MWTHIKNISGLDLYVSFDDNKIYGISSEMPRGVLLEALPEHFSYIGEYLADHTKQPMIFEALADFDLSWTTDFQLRVYKALALVPCGKTVTYGELAALAGSPKASRAVGSAMSNNRFLIAIPCHRVTAAGNKLGGFSSGIDNKIKLLSSEGIHDLR
ncbi:MAG: methylated-DNA--[protein]-cysteine S-methyltransferase [Deferribacterales bacterium]